MLQGDDKTSKAVKHCEKLGKVSGASAKALQKLFPACSSRSFTKGKRKFDPSEECIVADQKRKKSLQAPE